MPSVEPLHWAPTVDQDDHYIAEFQARRREFQPLWRRAVGYIFFPGFVIFLIGSQTDKLWLVIPGMALCLVGAARGAMLVFRYRRCPACGAIQFPRMYYPYRSCPTCGVRLSVGAKDST